MLDQLSGLINGDDGIRVLLVLSGPDGIGTVTVGLLLSVGLLIRLDVLDCLTNIILSLSEGNGVIITLLGVGTNLSGVIANGGSQVVNDSSASSRLGSSEAVVLGLVFEDTSNQLVQEHVHFIGGAFGLHEDLHH